MMSEDFATGPGRAPVAGEDGRHYSVQVATMHHLDDDQQSAAPRLLDELGRAGVSLAVRRGRLTVSGLVAGLTPLLVERLRERQAEIVALLVEVAR